MTIWRVTPTTSLDLSPTAPPRILGILNVTPDSFSDGGRWAALDSAVEQAERMLAEGAVGIDVGGESTRPGAQPVAVQEQIQRVVPVIEAVRKRAGPGPLITVDTTRAGVARAALDGGADAVNDVSGGSEDLAMLPLVAGRGCGIILMHRGTTPDRDSYSTDYGKAGGLKAPLGAAVDIVAEVKERLVALASRAVAAGVNWESIVLDPGLGFGKTVEQNLELVRRTGELVALGRPVMSGLSRKSFTARAAGLPDDTAPAQRLDATVALSRGHWKAGARLFRVHDVKEHAAAFRVGAPFLSEPSE